MAVRLLGVDLGDKRIGLAVSDPLGLTAQPLQVLPRRGGETDLQAIAAICARLEVGGVVVGLPRNMDGSLGPKAREAQEFAAALAAATGLPVELWDERLSTRAVERTLLEADASRRRRRQVVDKLAASYILQGYLDRHGRRTGRD